MTVLRKQRSLRFLGQNTSSEYQMLKPKITRTEKFAALLLIIIGIICALPYLLKQAAFIN